MSALFKLRWGVRTVGLPHALFGAGRLLLIKAQRPQQTVVRVRSAGLKLGMDIPAQLIPALVAFGDVIDPEYSFLTTVGRPGWTFVDVGAAIGQFSTYAARMCPAAHVVAFEPDQANLKRLIDNANRNGVGMLIDVLPMALGDTDGLGSLQVGSDSFRGTVADAGVGGTIEVHRFDSLAAELGITCDVLKINVAGGEVPVLRGAHRLLSRAEVGIILILLSDAVWEYLPTLRASGYRSFFYHPRERALCEVKDPSLDTRAMPWPARSVIVISPRYMPFVESSGIAVRG